MPPAVIGIGLVAAKVITVATLSYIALGVTVAGMITKNPKLMKIGGQLGLAAGVAGIATSFMGAGTAAAGSATGSAASTAGDVAKVAVGSGALGEPSSLPNADQTKMIGLDSTTSERGTLSVPYDTTPNYAGKMPDASFNQPPTGYGDPTANNGQFSSPVYGPGANQGTTQGLTKTLGANQGTNQGANIAPTGPVTANDTGSNPRANPDSNFFDFMNKDGNKYAIVEGGKIIAGGLQGLSATSNANVQLEENRRVGDIQRANMAQVGRGSYGLMGAR